jgi:hypothetical protein
MPKNDSIETTMPSSLDLGQGHERAMSAESNSLVEILIKQTT